MKNFITCRNCRSRRGSDVKICPACKMVKQKYEKITEAEGYRRQLIGSMKRITKNRMKKVITSNLFGDQ